MIRPVQWPGRSHSSTAPSTGIQNRADATTTSSAVTKFAVYGRLACSSTFAATIDAAVASNTNAVASGAQLRERGVAGTASAAEISTGSS